MTPTEFPEQTTVWAKSQPPYLPLPAYSDGTETISCWRLTWRERWRIFVSGRLWLRQMNFGEAVQPPPPTTTPTAESPFVVTWPERES